MGSDINRLDVPIYEAAEKMLHHNFWKHVTSGRVSPHWIDDGRRFWYRDEGPGGEAFVLVDPEARTITPALDHEQLSSNANHDPMQITSPDGRRAVVTREHDVWLIDLESGTERRVTFDGVPDRAYAVQPDALDYGVLMRKFGLPALPPLVRWSPDSRRVVTHRTNQVGVEMGYLIDAAPASGGRPELHRYHYALPGDETTASAELVVIDVESGAVIEAQSDPVFMPLVSPILVDWLWWDDLGGAVYYLDQPRDLQTLRLRRLDAMTGAVATVVEESGAPRVEPGQVIGQRNVRVLSQGEEVLWWSQRDGWGHLYLVDTRTGGERQLTRGRWLVQKVLHVDEAERVVYFVVSGLVDGEPLRRQVCRVGLDGQGFANVTDDARDHHVVVPPGGRYFLDHASTREAAPEISVRSWTGDLLVEVARADISRLTDLGWTPPQSFSVTAADGITEVHGMLFLPLNFDPSRSYPVIDSPYPGPQHGRVNPAFGGYPHGDREAQAIAALGFVVVAMDGRGTPGRSREFHDASFGHYATAGFLEDHVTALEQLAESRPWMDLERVGIYGESGGGYAAVRAMCRYPEVFKVGVSACGNHDQRFYHLAWGETFDGPLDDKRYAASSNVEIAAGLEGKLLLIHGGMDDNVHPHQTMRLVDRLIALDKDFDLLIVPGAEHLFVGYEAYVSRRRWDFLVRHLLGADPPTYRLAAVPLDPDIFFG